VREKDIGNGVLVTDLKENMVNFEQGDYSTQFFIDKEIKQGA
jgi:hypothetical protein